LFFLRHLFQRFRVLGSKVQGARLQKERARSEDRFDRGSRQKFKSAKFRPQGALLHPPGYCGQAGIKVLGSAFNVQGSGFPPSSRYPRDFGAASRASQIRNAECGMRKARLTTQGSRLQVSNNNALGIGQGAWRLVWGKE
jgi:hypothetical protein